MIEGANSPLMPYRVLDLTRDEGAFCAKLFAECGADVIKVEPVQGCATRRLSPLIRDRADSNASLWFHYYNSRKRSITLNFDVATGRDILMQLVAKSDIVLHAFSDKYLNERKLSSALFEAANPELILASISGPFDLTSDIHHSGETLLMATSGLLALSGSPDDAPCLPPHALAYPAASLFAAMGILSALEDGKGHSRFIHLDVNALHAASLLTDSGIAKSSLGILQKREGDAYSFIVPGGLYKCADGYVRIIGGQLRHWKALVEWMDIDSLRGEEWLDREHRNRNRVYIDQQIEIFTKIRARASLFSEGQSRRIPISPVATPDEFLNSSYARSRSFVTEVNGYFGRDLSALAPPFMFDGRREAPAAIGPSLGQHNWEVFVRDTELMTSAEMESLYAAGVL